MEKFALVIKKDGKFLAVNHGDFDQPFFTDHFSNAELWASFEQIGIYNDRFSDKLVGATVHEVLLVTEGTVTLNDQYPNFLKQQKIKFLQDQIDAINSSIAPAVPKKVKLYNPRFYKEVK